MLQDYERLMQTLLAKGNKQHYPVSTK